MPLGPCVLSGSPSRPCDLLGPVMRAALCREELETLFLPYDLKRLEMYSRNMVDYHLIMDMIPAIARMYFLNQLGDLALSAAQSVRCHLPGADSWAVQSSHVPATVCHAGAAISSHSLSARHVASILTPP